MSTLYPIRLPLDPAGNRVVHCYVVQAETLCLVDSGTALQYGLIEAGLAEISKTPADIDLIINTHAHLDHSGGNGRFAKTFDTPIQFHRKAARWIENMALYKAERSNPMFDKLHGGSTTATRYLEDGDEIDLGNIMLKVIYLPGHSDGQIGLFCEAEGWFLAADSIPPIHGRPVYTDVAKTLATIDKIERIAGLTALYHSHHDTPFVGDAIGERLQMGREFVKKVAALVQEAMTDNPAGDDAAHTSYCLEQLGFVGGPVSPMLIHSIKAHKAHSR
ncbi:MAG: MBL fold metallo-hydrolase [Chloroflexota bacterium]